MSVSASNKMMRALVESPFDPVAYLALADAFEEEGDEDRAELTRLTIKLHYDGDYPASVDDQHRLYQLLLDHVMPAVPVVVNSVGMAFAPIPAGTFLMGNPRIASEIGEGAASGPSDETPVVPVRITRPFFMGVFPLTCGQASKSGKATWRRHSSAQDYHPSTGMTWKQATTFCKKLSGLPAEKRAGRTYRLPTEAEWEYACRGPHAFHTEFNQGNRLVSGLFLFENLDMNELAFAGEEPLWAREGQHAPNAWGLYDMHGNVYEWCQDFYNAEAYEMLASELALQKGDYAEDPVDDWHDDSAYRVIRGGSAISDQYAARSSFRNLDDGASDHIGLRVVMIQE